MTNNKQSSTPASSTSSSNKIMGRLLVSATTMLVAVVTAGTVVMMMTTTTSVDGFQLQQHHHHHHHDQRHHHRQQQQQRRIYAATDDVTGDDDKDPSEGAASCSAAMISTETSATPTSRRSVLQRTASVLLGTSIFGGLVEVEPVSARLEAVDRPDLLPKAEEGYTNIIQTEKYLTSGQAKRLDTLLTNLEKDTGFRVRVLCQQYPNTPGLAIRDYWSLGKDDQKDDKYVVLVVDNFNGRGNALNFNVGDGVKFALPNVFWTRLSGKYGTTFFIKENGMDVAIENAVEAIVSCLRNEDGYCTAPPEQGQSMKSLGLR